MYFRTTAKQVNTYNIFQVAHYWFNFVLTCAVYLNFYQIIEYNYLGILPILFKINSENKFRNAYEMFDA